MSPGIAKYIKYEFGKRVRCKEREGERERKIVRYKERERERKRGRGERGSERGHQSYLTSIF